MDCYHETSNHENCGNCAVRRTCEKATHVENYHIDSGCSDFTPEEAGGEINEARTLLVRALDQLYLLGYDSGFTNPAIEGLITDIKNFLRGE